MEGRKKQRKMKEQGVSDAFVGGGWWRRLFVY